LGVSSIGENVILKVATALKGNEAELLHLIQPTLQLLYKNQAIA